VIKYLGAGANKLLAYGVASGGGHVLAVCSCTVLPLFAAYLRMGAGLGPATAFLYSGPAINVLAIALTARILGIELGIARAVGAIAVQYHHWPRHACHLPEEEMESCTCRRCRPPDVQRPLWQNMLYFASMVAVLVFANWAKPDEAHGVWHAVFSIKWLLELHWQPSPSA